MAILGNKFYSGKKAKNGDVIEFLNAGAWVETNFTKEDGTKSKSFQMSVKVNDTEECLMNLSVKNQSSLIPVFGKDTATWVGRRASVTVKEVEVAGKDQLSIRLKPIDETLKPVEETEDPESWK